MVEVLSLVSPHETASLTDGYAPEEARAMQRAVLRLFENWKVSDADAAIILGGIHPKTVRRWRSEEFGRVSRDLADRMSLLLGIHQALRTLFAESRRGYDWMSAANAAFGGASALDVLRRGGMEDIVRLRRYLDATRIGG